MINMPSAGRSANNPSRPSAEFRATQRQRARIDPPIPPAIDYGTVWRGRAQRGLGVLMLAAAWWWLPGSLVGFLVLVVGILLLVWPWSD